MIKRILKLIYGSYQVALRDGLVAQEGVSVMECQKLLSQRISVYG